MGVIRMADRVRIGIVGAGNFTTGRMLPGFLKAPDTEITVVANRSHESGERVAAQFGIPRVATDYREVVTSPDVDAVFIGAPPSVHKEVTFAALEAGKHVLCQTRMATTAGDARDMLEYAEEAAAQGIRTMLVPPAPFYRGSRLIDHLLESGYLGQLRHVQSFNVNATFADAKTPLSAGRNDLALYGQFNAMQLGLSYDVMSRWTGHARSVVAQRGSFVSERPLTEGGPITKNPYPDEITVIADTTSGAVALNLVNYSLYFADTRLELYGSEGTVVYHAKGDAIFAAHAGDQELQPMQIPPEHDNPWRIEEEFVRLVRGEIEQPSFSFADGVKNMEYLEAAYYAAVDGRRVDLP